MSTIAFIGAGNIGLPALKRLIEEGNKVKAYDVSSDRLELARAAGAEIGRSAADVASEAEFVITMVRSGEDVRRVYIDESVIAASRHDAILIDCSTIDIATCQSVSAAAAAGGRQMIDAPISGGVLRAASGTLTIMVGGEEAAFDRAEPVLKGLASSVHYMGPAGSGVATKLCNNLVAAITIGAISEAFALAGKFGLDYKKLFNVMNSSSAKCWALETMCPVPGPVPSAAANFNFKPNATASLVVKDLDATLISALKLHASMPLGSTTLSLFSMLCDAGLGELDASAIIKLFDGSLADLRKTS